MKRIGLTLAVLVFLLGGIMYGQVTDDLSVHLYGTLSQPTGDFGKEKGENAFPTRRFGFSIGDEVGLATTGFGGGAELSSSVWFEGLQWIFSMNALTNPVDKSALEPIYSDMLTDTSRTVSVALEFGQWINIPILSGFRYDYELSSGLTVYGLIQGGMNFSRRPSQKAIVDITPTEGSQVKAQEDLVAEDTKYDFARDFGFGAGAGLVINNRFNVGVRYFQLNHPKYEGTRQLSEKVFPDIFKRENEILGEERSISMLVVTLGIRMF